MRQQLEFLLASHRFLQGIRDDAPLLVPLAMRGRDAHQLVRFCRGIYPGAPMLVPLLDPGRGPNGQNLLDWDSPLAMRLDTLIRRAASLYELELVPTVIVGHGKGADLAIQVMMRCGSHVSAGILLRPTQAVTADVGSLDGLAVLLACDASGGGPAGLEQQLRRMMRTAGADVVSQRVNRRGSPGGLDAAVCHVFLEALFPASRPSATAI